MTHVPDNDLFEAFGKHLACLRRGKGISQKELALRIESEVARVSKLERGLGNPSLKTINRIANALDKPLNELFTFEIEIKKKKNKRKKN